MSPSYSFNVGGCPHCGQRVPLLMPDQNGKQRFVQHGQQEGLICPGSGEVEQERGAKSKDIGTADN